MSKEIVRYYCQHCKKEMTDGNKKKSKCCSHECYSYLKWGPLTGKRFNNLTLLKYTPHHGSDRATAYVRCDCGALLTIRADTLLSGIRKSCGCTTKVLSSKEMIGLRFSRLLVMEEVLIHEKPYPQVKCICDCGNEIITSIYRIQGKQTQSCGCLAIEHLIKPKHGLKKHALYKTWASMKARCYNPGSHGFIRYGGSGITVCDRWVNSFPNFLEDMGEKPTEKHTLDRIDNEKGYSLENCRWATRSEQNYNRRPYKMKKGSTN